MNGRSNLPARRDADEAEPQAMLPQAAMVPALPLDDGEVALNTPPQSLLYTLLGDVDSTRWKVKREC